MKKEGFTLVELLAVIAILAIIVILAVPNIIYLLNNARRNAFITEIQTAYYAANRRYMIGKIDGYTSYQRYSSLEGDNKLDIQNGSGDFQYCVIINTSGVITYMNVTNGVYKYENSSPSNSVDSDLVVEAGSDYTFKCE